MASRFANRTAERLRTELLQAAADLVVEHGWAGLRMQSVADGVGVSRQTVYNEFGDKDGLTQALALGVTDHVLDRVEEAVAAAPTIHEAWETAVTVALEVAAAEPVMAAAVTADDSGSFLHHFVSVPDVFALAQHRLAAAFLARWPNLAAEDLATAIEAAIRLAISHILLPLHPPADIARRTAQLLAAATTRPTEPIGKNSQPPGTASPANTTCSPARSSRWYESSSTTSIALNAPLGVRAANSRSAP